MTKKQNKNEAEKSGNDKSAEIFDFTELYAETGNAYSRESTDNSSNVFSSQYSAGEGGMATDMYCPGCGEEIFGSFLSIFMCPHCQIQIWRDEEGNVTHFEQKHTCPECGHTFGDMTDEASTEFRKMCRNIEQKAEGVFLGLDRIVNRIFS